MSSSFTIRKLQYYWNCCQKKLWLPESTDVIQNIFGTEQIYIDFAVIQKDGEELNAILVYLMKKESGWR